MINIILQKVFQIKIFKTKKKTKIFFNFNLQFSERMHSKAEEYMMKDHEDDPDFADHYTYYPYDKQKTNQRLDNIFERLFKNDILIVNLFSFLIS